MKSACSGQGQNAAKETEKSTVCLVFASSKCGHAPSKNVFHFELFSEEIVGSFTMNYKSCYSFQNSGAANIAILDIFTA